MKVLITKLSKIKTVPTEFLVNMILYTHDFNSDIVKRVMNHQTNPLLDNVAENATNNKDKCNHIVRLFTQW